MRRSAHVEGRCHLSGTVGPLTFEHVPPSTAFNDCRVLEADIHRLIGSDLTEELKHPKGKYNQRGAGSYTLCASCNSKTGSWYANAYISLVKKMYNLPFRLGSFECALVYVNCKPLNLLKQILTMFCSACPPDFSLKNPSVVRYSLNQYSGDFPHAIKIYLSPFDSRNSRATRQSGITGRLELGGESHIYSEISFPPFNLLMSLNSPPSDERLFDVTWFRNYALGEDADVRLILHNLPVNSYLPADYRGTEELRSKNDGAT